MKKNNLPKIISHSVLSLGLTAIITQIITLREFFQLVSGNELVLGIILGNWLFLTGFGCFLGHFTKKWKRTLNKIFLLQIFIGLLPLIQLTNIRIIKGLLIPGITLNLSQSLWISFVVLAPFCIVSGLFLTLTSNYISQERTKNQISRVYFYDTLGAILGGLMFSLFLIYAFTPYQVLTITFVLNFFMGLTLSLELNRYWWSLFVLLFILTLITGLALIDPEKRTLEIIYPNTNIVSSNYSPYGQITVTNKKKQRTVYENNTPISAQDDTKFAKEIISLTLFQTPEPKNLLLISGGLSGIIHQASKHKSIKSIDYLELDPSIQKLVKSTNDIHLFKIGMDTKRYLSISQKKYDAIIMNLPTPINAQINRFYTLEFFEKIKKALSKKGVFCFSLMATADHSNDKHVNFKASVYQALKESFQDTHIIPGNPYYYQAADHALKKDIVLKKEYSLAHKQFIKKITEMKINANSDFHPVSYSSYFQLWLQSSSGNFILPLICFGLILVFLIFILKASPKPLITTSVMTTGFTGMALEIIILIAFQIMYGYIYQQLSIIITAFLASAALGAFMSNKTPHNPFKLFVRLDLLIAVFSYALASILISLNTTQTTWAHYVLPYLAFPLLTAFIGFQIGAQFTLATRLIFEGIEKTASHVFAADLLGACFGAFVASAIAIPAFGIKTTCLILGTLKLSTTLLLRLKSHYEKT